MIKIDNGAVSISGSKCEIQVELTCVIRSLLEHGFDVDDIKMCIETATLSEEEVVKRIVNGFEDLLNDMLKELKD